MVTGESIATTVIGSSVASRVNLLSVQLTSGPVVAGGETIRTPKCSSAEAQKSRWS